MTETAATPAAGKSSRRMRLLINKKFQRMLILYMLAIGVSLIGIQAYLNHTLGLELIVLGQAARQSIDPSVIDPFVETNRLLFQKYLIFSFSFTVMACGVGGLLLSHRIAGPVYRTLQVIEMINRGETVRTPVRLRSGDCFPELESALNDLLKTVQK